MKKHMMLSLFWIGLALTFNLGLYFQSGSELALTFLTGYLIEKSLSIDNLFVFITIFSFFKLPPPLQKKIFHYGIWSAIFLRGLMIWGGVALVQKFEWILIIFGLFLLITSFKMAFHQENETPLEKSKLMQFLQKHLPCTPTLQGSHFFIRQNQKWHATPLFLALIFIELTDLVFATDSIPAIFAITQNPFIIFSSNVFAILGLRALYFVLADLLKSLHYLRYGLALILGLMGLKLILSEHFHISPLSSCLMIISILCITFLASWVYAQKKK